MPSCSHKAVNILKVSVFLHDDKYYVLILAIMPSL